MSRMSEQLHTSHSRVGVVLLATLGERQTIRYVLEEVAESVRLLQESGYSFQVLIVDDSQDIEYNRHVEQSLPIYTFQGRFLTVPGRGWVPQLFTVSNKPCSMNKSDSSSTSTPMVSMMHGKCLTWCARILLRRAKSRSDLVGRRAVRPPVCRLSARCFHGFPQQCFTEWECRRQ